MRSLHRWVMTAFVLLLIYWVGSGLVMATYDVLDSRQSWAREGGGAGARPVSALTDADLDPMLDVMLGAVKVASRNAQVTAVVLRIVDGEPLGIVGTAGALPKQFIINARTGVMLSEKAAEPPDAPGGAGSLFMGTYLPSLHNQIKDWHRGNALGDAGIWLALLTGCTLLTLSVTGIWIYLQMWLKRRKSARRSLFW